MTEEEIKGLAREYIDSCTARAGFVILTEGIKNDFIDLFVAGFMKCLEQKADRPKWHKVADRDLPPVNTTVLNEDCDKVMYYGDGKWQEYSEYYEDYIDIEPPTAWCEKPEYMEEAKHD